MTPASSLALPSSLNAALPSWGLIRASGADARTFLHGQLSNDLQALPADAVQWSAYCTAKGRMLAGFLSWADGGGTIWLACDRSLVAGLVKRLRMFVLRAKVVLDDLSGDWQVHGVLGSPGPGPMRVARDGEGFAVGLPAADGVARHLVVKPDAAVAAEDESAWHRAMVHAGEAWIVPATQEQFVPQMINFDAIGGISFRKGCYPGQEIVARAHYRGAVKRRMRRALVAAAAQAGMPLFSAGPDGQECGIVANAVPADGGSELLAVVPIDAADGGIRLGAADGPLLAFADLPYAIPDAA